MFQCAGNVIGPQVYLSREAPVYLTGLYVDIACWCMLLILALSMGVYLNYLNKRKEAQRVAMGLPANLKDMSIMTTEEADAYRKELSERLAAEGFDESRLWGQAFDDMTDFENPMFAYVL